MPPLHRVVVDFHHDDDDDEGFFLPLDRRWSDASEVSAYSIHPDDQALRVHPYQVLENKKVAVIGNSANAFICASVLQQDGHQVTVLSDTSVGTSPTPLQHLHPDFPLQENHHTTQQSYNEDCAKHFGVHIQQDIQVMGMTEKNGGWFLSMQGSNNKKQQSFHSHEYFDFVVVVASRPSPSSDTGMGKVPNRLYDQYLAPIFFAVAAFICAVLNLSSQQQNATNHHLHTIPTYLPTKYRTMPRLYRRMLAREIPSVAFVGGSSSSSSSTYLSSVWLSTMLHGEMTLPEQLPTSSRRQSRQSFPLELNDLLLQDMGLNSKRKDGVVGELFGAYSERDYSGVLHEVQQRRHISAREGWGVPLTPVAGDI